MELTVDLLKERICLGQKLAEIDKVVYSRAKEIVLYCYPDTTFRSANFTVCSNGIVYIEPVVYSGWYGDIDDHEINISFEEFVGDYTANKYVVKIKNWWIKKLDRRKKQLKDEIAMQKERDHKEFHRLAKKLGYDLPKEGQ